MYLLGLQVLKSGKMEEAIKIFETVYAANFAACFGSSWLLLR